MRISALIARKHNNTSFPQTEMSPNVSITEKLAFQIRALLLNVWHATTVTSVTVVV